MYLLLTSQIKNYSLTAIMLALFSALPGFCVDSKSEWSIAGTINGFGPDLKGSAEREVSFWCVYISKNMNKETVRIRGGYQFTVKTTAEGKYKILPKLQDGWGPRMIFGKYYLHVRFKGEYMGGPIRFELQEKNSHLKNVNIKVDKVAPKKLQFKVVDFETGQVVVNEKFKAYVGAPRVGRSDSYLLKKWFLEETTSDKNGIVRFESLLDFPIRIKLMGNRMGLGQTTWVKGNTGDPKATYMLSDNNFNLEPNTKINLKDDEIVLKVIAKGKSILWSPLSSAKPGDLVKFGRLTNDYRKFEKVPPVEVEVNRFGIVKTKIVKGGKFRIISINEKKSRSQHVFYFRGFAGAR